MSRKRSDTFSKAERITSKLIIDKLFEKTNDTVTAYPFKVVYMPIQQAETPVSIVISIPKKRFHNAVERNRMKRLVREAYRRQKHQLIEIMETKGQGLAIAFICITSDMCNYNIIYNSIGKALGKISDAICSSPC